MVTPHVGVWIETELKQWSDFLDEVTPHVGVWIETSHGRFEGFAG